MSAGYLYAVANTGGMGQAFVLGAVFAATYRILIALSKKIEDLFTKIQSWIGTDKLDPTYTIKNPSILNLRR